MVTLNPSTPLPDPRGGGPLFLITQWFGSFLFHGHTLMDHRLFPRSVDGIVDRNRRIRNNGILPEERELAGGRGEIGVREPRLLGIRNTYLISGGPDRGTTMVEDSMEGDDGRIPEDEGSEHRKEEGIQDGIHDRIQDGIQDGMAPEFGPMDPSMYGYHHDLLRQALIMLSTEKLEQTLAARGIMESIAALDDLYRTINLLREREAEWLRAYPHGNPPPVFTEFTGSIEHLESCRTSLTRAIEEAMDTESPSLSSLAGPLLGARLIAHAGGSERLARLPASTIQILGAEQAFFRYRRTGSGMPKHGIIFQHPLVRKARKQDRGKIARALAGKIAMAARIDHFSGRDEGEALMEGLRIRISRIAGG